MKHLASIVTVSRVFVAIAFYAIVVAFKEFDVWVLFACFALIEASDILDGFVARKTKTVSDLGKLLDPLCDVTAHFLCIYALQQVGLAPPIIVVIFILREVWVQMLRMQLLKRKVVLSARAGGKIKTWLFGMSIFASLLIYPNSFLFEHALYLRNAVFVLYYLAGIMSMFSGLQYLFGTMHALKNDAEE